MRAGLASALAIAAVLAGSGPALSEPVPPPDLDCSLGFEALRNQLAWMPGAQRDSAGGRDVVAFADPEVWRVEIRFTLPGEPAHPAITLRKFVKQVTGVWTAQSKACGYGDRAQFDALMAALKVEDSRLTNASRDDAERRKRERSPLSPMP